MSDFSARKQPPVVSLSSDARSKRLEETLEKLSSIKAERNNVEGSSSMPDVSAKKADSDNIASDGNSFSVTRSSGLSLRVTSAPKDDAKEEAAEQAVKPVNQDNAVKSVSSAPMITIEKKTPKEEKPAFDPLLSRSMDDDKLEDKAVDKFGSAPAVKPEIKSEKLKENKDLVKEEMFEGDVDNEPVLMLSPGNTMPLARSHKYKITTLVGTGLTVFWFMLAGYYVQNTMGMGALLTQQPHILGGFLAGIMAPVALLWMVLAYIQRGSDIHMYADALRAELQAMIFPSEERSQVINKDIEELVNQAAELSASSKTVLNSIHRARIGLRNEIRDFSGLSKKAEFHIDRLADSLTARSNKLLVLTDEIEKRTTSLDAKTLSGAKAWDDAATSILSRASDIEEAMRKGARQIVEAANEAEETTGTINTKLTDSFDVLKTSVESVKGMTSSTVKAIMEASETIENNRDTLSEGAKTLTAKATEITDALNGSVASFQDSVESMVEKTDTLESRLNNRVNSLTGVLNEMDGKISTIENVGTETANKLSEAMVSAISGADNISSAVRRAIESLSKATSEAKMQAEQIVDETTVKITGLQKTSEHSAESIRNILNLVDSSRERMQQASEMVGAQVEKLSAAVEMQSAEIEKAQNTLNDRVEAIHLHMNEPLEAMARAVDNASEKHAKIEETLSKRVEELNSASDKALLNANTIRDNLRTQAQEISTLVGQIAGHSRSVQSMISSQKDDLSQNVGEALVKIEGVSAALQSQSEQLTLIAEEAEKNISHLKGSITDQCTEVSGGTTKVIDELRDLDETIDSKVRSLVEKSYEATKSVSGVTSALVESAETVEPIYMKATNQIDTARERFVKMTETFDEGTTSNLDKLKSMGIMFDERLQTLTASAEDASRILDRSGENLSNRVEDIESATQAASERLQDMERLFKNQASDIHLTTDHALLKIENIQKALNEQFHDLSVSVAESVAQIENVGQNFVKQTDVIKTVSNNAIMQFDNVGSKADEQTQQLRHLAKVTADQMGQIVKRVQDESKLLLESSSQTLLDLKKAGDGFANRAKEVEEQMRLSLKTTHEYGDHLDKQADKIADTSHKTADQIAEAIAKLSGKMLDVNKAANDVSGRIESSREKLSAETDHLAEVSIKAARVVDEAASSYVRQSNSLFKATQDAVSQAEKIRQSEGRVQRETFLNSTKFILESLHSLSVDLTRLMEGEIQDKVWKAYQRGDIGAFTARLLDIRDKLPFEKMRDKYGMDNEFRTYVNRFVRQFEEVYDQAADNDHGEILAGTFASSDVGKLYEILCDIAGRQSLIKKKQLRAA